MKMDRTALILNWPRDSPLRVLYYFDFDDLNASFQDEEMENSIISVPAMPKLRMERTFAWPHHREGWKRVEALIREHLTCPDGVRFVSAVEDQLYYIGPIEEPWIGVIHQVPRHNLPGFPDVERLLKLPAWHTSASHCLGLWTLSQYVRRFLQDSGVDLPISVIPYVTSMDVPSFDWNRFASQTPPRLLHVGEFLRNYQAFFDLDVPGWRKQMLEPTDWSERFLEVTDNGSVDLLPPVDVETYDCLLTESVVFIHLRDAPANTTIVECIARATPICVNRVGGVSEYLGDQYPLYHDGNAAHLLREHDRIHDAHAYLLERRKQIGNDDDFLKKASSNAVYRLIPTPPGQLASFQRFVVTVLIATFARLYNLREQLGRLARQQDAPRFEVVLWNNSRQSSVYIDEVVREFDTQLCIRVIHSSDNIYCSMRFAIPAIARSDTLLVCDDDVLPEPHYIRTLYDAHCRLGSDVAVCLRGHVFRPHTLSLEKPDLAWRLGECMTLYDQADAECTVDFAHADNFIISMNLLRRATLYPMTHPEYVLVDDYWLSYVLSAYLGASCRKIQAPDIFHFTDCSDDTSIALYHNPKVHDQRTRLYVEHMLAGWPNAIHSSGPTALRSAETTRSTSSSDIPT